MTAEHMWQARQDRLAEPIDRLPVLGRELVLKYLSRIERLGRCSPTGSAIAAVEEFVADVATAFARTHELPR